MERERERERGRATEKGRFFLLALSHLFPHPSVRPKPSKRIFRCRRKKEQKREKKKKLQKILLLFCFDDDNDDDFGDDVDDDDDDAFDFEGATFWPKKGFFRKLRG